MNRHYEVIYHQLEEQHWWFAGRRDMTFRLVQQLALPPDAAILEVGCSGGPLLLALRTAGFRRLMGIDISADSIALAQARGLSNVAVMDGAHLTFPDQSFDLLIASDVLEHIEDEAQALREWRRVLRPGGRLIVFVPAYRQLWSAHDVANHHFRRYSRATLRQALRRSGWRVNRLSYWNFTLFFPAYLVRTGQRRLRGGRPLAAASGDLHGLPRPLNQLLIWLLRGENVWLRRLNFPVGVSVFALAQR